MAHMAYYSTGGNVPKGRELTQREQRLMKELFRMADKNRCFVVVVVLLSFMLLYVVVLRPVSILVRVGVGSDY